MRDELIRKKNSTIMFGIIEKTKKRHIAVFRTAPPSRQKLKRKSKKHAILVKKRIEVSLLGMQIVINGIKTMPTNKNAIRNFSCFMRR
jgi:hypothetical protein